MLEIQSFEQSTIVVKRAVAHASASRTSWIGLCAASFFLAEIGGVTMPFVNTYLVECGWGYDTIGAATAFAGHVSFLTHSPAGFIVDRTRRRRVLLAAASLLVGVCIGSLPLLCDRRIGIVALLAVAGVGKPFFGPITNALTLGLVGNAGLNRALGVKEGWNHAGNIAAALTAMALVSHFPVSAVFFAAAVASMLAAVSVFLIRPIDLHGDRLAGLPLAHPTVPFLELIRDRRVATLLAAVPLFRLANAPVMPLVAQKILFVGGSNSQVAGVVLIAQAIMVPVSLVAGLLGDRWGRKPVLAIGFTVLPVRICLYAFTDDPSPLVALQALDGIGAGIFGVTAVAVCGDLTRDRGHFNGLVGVLATAVGTGAVVGPFASGLIVQNLGFSAAFFTFSGIAMAAAVLLIGWVPETKGKPD